MMDEALGPPYFLTSSEYELVRALVETIVPAGKGPPPEPGAGDVGAHNYFDSRLLDLPEEARQMLRSALRLFDDRAGQEYGKPFVGLSPEERLRVLRSLLADPTTMAHAFAVRAVCLEGFYSDYCDPSYTGRSAWDLIDFKGKRIDGIKKDWSFLRIYKNKDEGA